MPSAHAQPATLKGAGGAKRSEAAIRRRKHKAKARSKVKKLRAEGAAVPKALALAVRPAKRGLPRRDQANGFAAKLLAAGQDTPAEATTGAATSGTAASAPRPVSAGSTSATAAPIDDWCRRGALVRFTNRRVGEVLADPDSDCEVKLKWLDDGQESGFVHLSQLEYVAADVEEYADDGEGPVRKPHKKAARKAAREAAAAAAVAHTTATPVDAARAAEARIDAATATVAAVAPAESTAEGGAGEERTKANHRKKRKKDKSKRRKEKK